MLGPISFVPKTPVPDTSKKPAAIDYSRFDNIRDSDDSSDSSDDDFHLATMT